jgi:pilus assembly protein FimV
MSPRLNRVWLLVPFLLLASQAWALGLGDIRLSSALNEPLRAEIELLAATSEELNNLTIQLASQETFQRYDLDRPLYLTRLRFQIVKSGRADGNVVRITSTEPLTEPFVTFLVEAAWSRGRLLREYTLLLDPPTFAPPPVAQAAQPVTAPTRATPADSGQIQRQAPPQQDTPPPSRPPVQAPVRPPAQAPAQSTPRPAPAAPAPSVAAEPADSPAPDDSFGQPNFDTSPGGDMVIQRGDTLWGITQRVRPDSRLTINQTMLAIYEANPGAFDGNINRMRAGATLRIPSADDVFRISRSDAFTEVQRQNTEWRGGVPAPGPAISPVDTQPSLTLVPPDAEDDISLSDTSIETGVADAAADPVADEVFVDPVEERINEIQMILEDQDALIEIPSNELAALRAELAELRGEELPVEDLADEAPVDDLLIDDDVAVDDEILADDSAEPEIESAPQVVSRPAQEDSIVDTLLGYLNNFWVWIGTALVATVGILFWFMRRAARRDDEEATGVWEALDSDELDTESVASTERLRALARDEEESFVVVETQESPMLEMPGISDTMEAPAAEEPDFPPLEEYSPDDEDVPTVAAERSSQTGTNKALEDTFSSETAINLDQTDPVAEADFHMAYGLYDQAADLINGALAAEPERHDLLAKLCEIYFVWGNRDAFIDAAGRFKTLAGNKPNTEWDKIIIMGQQIAGDHEMFTGVSTEGVTKAVDLSFDGGMDEAGDLDMDFASGPDSGGSDIIDLGAQFGIDDDIVGDDTGQVLIRPDSGSGIDFSLEEEPDVAASATVEMPGQDDDTDIPTFESSAGGDTAQSPTIEQQFELEATGELPAISEPDFPDIPASDATAEIDLDDLGLDLGGLDETALAGDIDDEDHVSDLDDTATSQTLEFGDDLEITGTNDALELDDELAETGRNEALSADDELDATSRNKKLQLPDDDIGATGMQEAIDATGIQEALDASGELPSLDDMDTGFDSSLGDDQATMLASLDDDDDNEDTDVGIDTSLLDATGQTQILTEDMAVDTGVNPDLSGLDATMLAPGYGEEDTVATMSDDAATLLAPLDDDEDDGDFDFAKTEALPKDVFSPNMSTDDTGRMPGLAGSTDMDLDLDDLTAALKVSEVGDTVNQVRDDATVEQPRLRSRGGDETGVTQTLAPEDMSGDLHDARTMTEVGTKLDLARAYVDMGDPSGARSILEEVLDEGDAAQKQQAQQLIDSLPD